MDYNMGETSQGQETNLRSTDDRLARYADGMQPGSFQNVLEEIRWEPPWRRQSDKGADYYDSNQLDNETLQRMRDRGIAPIVYNICAPVIDVSIGLEARNRTDARVLESGDTPEKWTQVASVLGSRLHKAERRSHLDKACADAYGTMLKAGIAWVEVARENNPMEYPYRAAHIHRREMFWDWRDLSRDLRHARYLVRSKWQDVDVARMLMPEHKELINEVYNGWQGHNDLDLDLLSRTDLAQGFEDERIFVIPDFEWRNTARRRIRFYETWYRVWKRSFVMKLAHGKTLPFDRENREHIAALLSGQVQVEPAVFPEVRLAMWMGPHRMFDVPSPYRHGRFPYIPFFCYREDLTGVPYGLMRRMMPAQDEVNARRSKIMWYLASRRLIADSDAIDKTHNSHDEVMDELSRPDAAIWLNPERKNRDDKAFRVEANLDITDSQRWMYEDAVGMVNKSAGVFQTMLGDTSAKGQPRAGVAINSLIEQGITTLAGANDNFQFGRVRCTEHLLDMVKEDLETGEKHLTIGSGKAKRTIILNQRVEKTDAAGNTTSSILNHVRMAEVELELEEVPSTPTQRQQDFAALSELVKGLAPEVQAAVTDFIIEASTLRDRAKIADRIRRVLNLPEDVPPEQADAAREAAEAQAAEQADLMKRAAEAKIRKDNAGAEKTEVEAAAKSVEMAATMQTGGVDLSQALEQSQKALDAAEKQIQDLEATIREMEITTTSEIERERMKTALTKVQSAMREAQAQMKAAQAQDAAQAQVTQQGVKHEVEKGSMQVQHAGELERASIQGEQQKAKAGLQLQNTKAKGEVAADRAKHGGAQATDRAKHQGQQQVKHEQRKGEIAVAREKQKGLAAVQQARRQAQSKPKK